LENKNIHRNEYDERNDILYLSFLDVPAYGCYGDDDVFENVIIQRKISNDEITGFTVLFAKSEKKSRENELRKLGYLIDLDSYIPAV